LKDLKQQKRSEQIRKSEKIGREGKTKEVEGRNFITHLENYTEKQEKL